MITRRNIITVGLVGAMLTASLAATADDGATTDEFRTVAPATVEIEVVATDFNVDDGATTDRRGTDRRVTDRSDRVRPTDERPVRRCARVADNPRRCVDDHPTDITYRHLLWRLFKAHEWKKLIRLLEHLGLI